MKTIEQVCKETFAKTKASEMLDRPVIYAEALVEITQIDIVRERRITDLEDLLVRVLSVVEDAERDPSYKPGAMRKLVTELRAAIAAAEGAR